MEQTDLADHDKPSLSIALRIDSQLENTVMVAMAVRGICALTSLTTKEVNRVELCVTEVVNNAIEHAYDGKKGNGVNVNITLLKNESITVSVTDHGKKMMGFDEKQKAASSMPDSKNPKTWKTSGRGLAIVTKIMQKVNYCSINGQNTLSMSYPFA